MATSITATRAARRAASIVNDLIHVELDAIEAYEAALDRLDDPETREQLLAFVEDHRQHARELGELVSALGGEPVRSPDVKRILAQGKVVLARLAGDKAVLQAMRSNENETNTRYERAREAPELDARARAVLARHLEDERRHRAWIVHRIEALSDRL